MTACAPIQPFEKFPETLLTMTPSVRILPSNIVILLAGVFILPLSSCQGGGAGNNDNWPPFSNELHQEFRENQEGLELLSKELAGSKYSSVILWGDNAIEASIYGSEGYEKVEVEDPQFWKALFEDAAVDTAEGYRNEISLHNRFQTAGNFEDTVYDYQFVMTDNQDVPECIPQFAEMDCGTCVEQLGNSWYLRLFWYPLELVSEFEGLDTADSEAFDEILSKLEPKLGACLSRFLDVELPIETNLQE